MFGFKKKFDWKAEGRHAFGDFYYYAEADGIMVLATPAKYLKITEGVNAVICRAYLDKKVPQVAAAFPDSDSSATFILVSAKFFDLSKKLREALLLWNRGFINEAYSDTIAYSFGVSSMDEARYLAADRYLLSNGYSVAMVKRVICWSTSQFRKARIKAIKSYAKHAKADEADKVVLEKVLSMMESSPEGIVDGEIPNESNDVTSAPDGVSFQV